MKINDVIAIIAPGTGFTVRATIAAVQDGVPTRVQLTVSDGDTYLNGTVEASPGSTLAFNDVLTAAIEGIERFPHVPEEPRRPVAEA